MQTKSMHHARCSIDTLIGKTFADVQSDNESVTFSSPGKRQGFKLFHDQDCCESVWLEEVVGDLSDLENSEILLAEEVTSRKLPPINSNDDSWTWTFYKFSTIKGSVTLRWYGFSNGYYSESVSCYKWELENDINPA